MHSAMDDKGGRGDKANADDGWQRGEGGLGKCWQWMTKGDGGLSNAEITGKCLKMARKYGFLSNSSGLFNNFCQIIYFLPKKN